jgi:ligand-binding sensor domain-containing protein/DNA-binding CsgD family transcriptional regulator
MTRVRIIPCRILVSLLLVACAGMPAGSQTGKGSGITFEQLSLQHGLSQSIVKSIAQDRLGFLYFGTEDGLNRYDGYHFSVIRHDPGNANSLSYNDVSALCIDRRGFIWAGTFNAGLNRYDPASGNVLRFRSDLNDPGSLSHDNVLAIIEDGNGNIWVACERGLNRLAPDPGAGGGYRIARFRHDPGDRSSLGHDQVNALCLDRDGIMWIGTEAGLDRLEPGKAGQPIFRHYRHDSTDPSSLSDNAVRSILQDSLGELWIGTQHGLNRIVRRSDGTKEASPPQSIAFRHYFHDPRDDASLSHDQVFALQEDGNGTLWVGTNGGGICLLDRQGGTFRQFRHDPLNPRSVSHDEIRAIYRDRQGIMWVGTYGSGVDKVARGSDQFVYFPYIPNSEDSIGNAIVWAIYEDDEDILWIGTHGGGLDRLDRKSGRFRHYRSDSERTGSLSSDFVRVVRDAGGGDLWIGTHGGGICRFDPRTERFQAYRHDPDDPSSLGFDQVREIYRDRAGTVWVGTFGQGLDRMDEATGTFAHFRNVPGDPRSLSNNFVRAIHEDEAGNFWIGTEGGGLNLFDRKAGTFRAFRASAGLAMTHVFAIHEDLDGILWLGVLGVGLTRFDPELETFKNYTPRDGLPSDFVYGILEDEQRNLWLSTNNGLAMFDPEQERFRIFGPGDGLQDREFNGSSYFQSRKGEMFFGGINGFNAFFPSRIQANTYVPPVVIEAFQKFNKDVDLGRPVHELKEIRLSYKDTVFSFEFTALDFTAPAKNRYTYIMEGLNKEWIETDSEKRFAHFTTVPPGRYVFRVKGSNSDGIWNEAGAALTVIISPPFWLTWWFRVPAFLILLFLVFAWSQSRVKRAAARIRTESAMEQFLNRYNISQREKEIIHLILEGKSNKEIEETLFISMGTVKNHVYNIYQKLDVNNRAQLMALFQNLRVQ